MGKQLLAEAGFPNGEGLEEFSDHLRLTYSIEREPAMGPAAIVIQSALRAAGGGRHHASCACVTCHDATTSDGYGTAGSQLTAQPCPMCAHVRPHRRMIRRAS